MEVSEFRAWHAAAERLQLRSGGDEATVAGWALPAAGSRRGPSDQEWNRLTR